MSHRTQKQIFSCVFFSIHNNAFMHLICCWEILHFKLLIIGMVIYLNSCMEILDSYLIKTSLYLQLEKRCNRNFFHHRFMAQTDCHWIRCHNAMQCLDQIMSAKYWYKCLCLNIYMCTKKIKRRILKEWQYVYTRSLSLGYL